jgi:hypothetical protein
MKSKEALYQMKLERLQKEERYFDQLQMIRNEAMNCLPSVSPLPLPPLTDSSSTITPDTIEFLKDLTIQTDSTLLVSSSSSSSSLPSSSSLSSRILPPVTRAHLPRESLKYFIHLKKKSQINDEKVKEKKDDHDNDFINVIESSPMINGQTTEKIIVTPNMIIESQEDTHRRHRLRRLESTTNSISQSKSYATKKKISLKSELPVVILSSQQDLTTTTPTEPTDSSSAVFSSSSPMKKLPPHPSYYHSPVWLSMPQLSHLNETIYSNKQLSLDLVSHIPSIQLSQSKYFVSNSTFKIGTSSSCDCIITPDLSYASQLSRMNPRDICHIASIHTILTVTQQPQHSLHPSSLPSSSLPLFSSSSPSSSSPSSSLPPSSPPTTSSSHLSSFSSLSVTVVDNHTLWGTYIVTMNGVEKVNTIVTKGNSLHSGDLLCLGLIRNGPKRMSSVDANKALLVFRIRIE